MIKIIGITGPSGSGKSLLCGYLSEAGIPCINADEVYHSMLIPPSRCLDKIREAFGDDVITADGSLDRKVLSKCVFNNADKLDLLNRTVLPIVIDEIRNIISCFEKEGKNVVAVDAPTLIESGFHRECTLVVAVIAPIKERIERIEERDNIPESFAEMRANAQQPDSFYTSAAHISIVNGSSTEALRDNAYELIEKINEL